MKLKELRESQHETQLSISKKLGIPYHNYNKYELGQVEPDIQTIIKIANFYNISIDYLLERQFGSDLELGHLSTEKKEAVKLLLKLNDLNFIKAVSYMAGLYTAQG